MNMAVRRFCQSIPVVRDLYQMARARYHRHRYTAAAEDYFCNFEDYRKAIEIEDGQIVDLQTKDGLIISVRRNYMDAAILEEVFLDQCYLRGVTLPEKPTIVDIGGYIGDFALYAVKRLDAGKVVVCEPAPRNWALLTRNVANNHYEDRIDAVNKAVTGGEDVMMNVNAPDRAQARISAYAQTEVQRQPIPGVSLASLVEHYRLSVIDLLKIDCEGGEYAILLATPSEVFARIRHIVFECHEIDGFKTKLAAVKQRLAREGFSVKVRGSLVFAAR
jgi:FkbM family methyltransferase